MVLCIIRLPKFVPSNFTTVLRKHEITAGDIDYVIGTHGHSDHIGNLNLFTNATHIVSHDINKGSLYRSHPFDQVCVAYISLIEYDQPGGMIFMA